MKSPIRKLNRSAKTKIDRTLQDKRFPRNPRYRSKQRGAYQPIDAVALGPLEDWRGDQ